MLVVDWQNSTFCVSISVLVGEKNAFRWWNHHMFGWLITVQCTIFQAKWRFPKNGDTPKIPKSYIFIGYSMYIYIYICSLAFPKWYKPSILGSADIRWRQGAARLKRRSKDFNVKVPCELRGRLDHLPMVPLKKPWENPWENHGENIYGLDHWRLP